MTDSNFRLPEFGAVLAITPGKNRTNNAQT